MRNSWLHAICLLLLGGGILAGAYIACILAIGDRVPARVLEERTVSDYRGRPFTKLRIIYTLQQNSFEQWIPEPTFGEYVPGDDLHLACRPKDPSRCLPVADLYLLLLPIGLFLLSAGLVAYISRSQKNFMKSIIAAGRPSGVRDRI